MRLKHFIEAQQLDPDLLDNLFERADEMRYSPHFHPALQNRILATFFYEPSTRTRLSFEIAMLKLGGNVVTTENARDFSSAIKGESIEDSIRVISSYDVDAIVIRHPEDGAAKRAADVSHIPIINAGDGKGQHPTQALLDLYTIKKEMGGVEGLKVACVGDLASGRTARSLCYLLGKFPGNEIAFVSPENLKMREDIKEYLAKHETIFREVDNLNDVLAWADIVYVTRLQKERLSPEDIEKARGKYVINSDNLALIKPNSRVMHPLPKIDEIDLSIEIEQNDQRIAYFRQAENGLYVRMALLNELIDH